MQVDYESLSFYQTVGTHDPSFLYFDPIHAGCGALEVCRIHGCKLHAQGVQAR